MQSQMLLKLSGVSKAFLGIRALKSVSFDLSAGEVHALVGENGAGKSTLIKVITGAHQPDEGTLEVRGQLVADNDPVRARALGIAAIYQQPAGSFQIFPSPKTSRSVSSRRAPGVAFVGASGGDGRRSSLAGSVRRSTRKPKSAN